MLEFEGAEAAARDASGMAGVTTSLVGQVRGATHVVAAKALFGSCRWVSRTSCRASASPHLVDGLDLDQWKAAVRRTPRHSSSKARPIRRWRSSTSARSAGIAHAGRRDAGGRQRVATPDLA